MVNNKTVTNDLKTNKDIWTKFSRGDHITDAELNHLIKMAEDALPYLEARSPRYNLALFPTRLDLEKLIEYKEARKNKLWRDKQ